jgi:hypothetical protein
MKRSAQRDWCQEPGCRRPADLVYLGRGMCDRHWQARCAANERGGQSAELKVQNAEGAPGAPVPQVSTEHSALNSSLGSPQIGLLFDLRA